MKSLIWIEENPHITYALQEVFSNPRYGLNEWLKIIFLASPHQAQAYMATHEVDVVLLDPIVLDDAFCATLKGQRLFFYTHLNASEFVPLAKKHQVTHVLIKALPFDGNALVEQLKRCLIPNFHESVWGFETATKEVFRIDNSDDMLTVMGRIEGVLENALTLESRMEICTPLMEAITNAVYHAPKQVPHEEEDKYRKGQHIDSLNKGEAVTVTLHVNEEWVVVGIKDFQGTLQVESILHGLSKNFTQEGIYAENGRGFFLMYCLMDELQITLVPEKSSEILLVKSRQAVANDESESPLIFVSEDEGAIKNKPLIVNVLSC
jgi:anti-sigma regulatory factor (Ser/Thr protein kinase)